MFGLPSKGIRFARRERGLSGWKRPGDDNQFAEWVEEAANRIAEETMREMNLVIVDKNGRTVNNISVDEWHDKMKAEIEELRRLALDAETRFSAVHAAKLNERADRLSALRMWILAADVVTPQEDDGPGDRCLHGFPLGMHCMALGVVAADAKASEPLHTELED